MRRKSEREERAFQVKLERAYHENGWTVLNKGWPDIIVFKNGEFRLIECKFNFSRLNQAQKILIGLLKKHGLNVYVAHYTKEKRYFLFDDLETYMCASGEKAGLQRFKERILKIKMGEL